jgi:hypothetical protein
MLTAIQLILGSSFVSAVTSQLLQARQKNKDTTKAVRFAALNLSHQLEDYAFECMEEFSDDDLFTQSNRQAGAWAKIPDFTIPKDDFSKFPIPLVDQLFSLPKDIRSAQKEVEFVAGIAGDLDDARSIAVRHVISLGIKTLELSCQIRAEYNLPERTVPYGSGNLMDALKSNKK